MKVRLRTAWAELDRAAEAFFRLLPFRVACVDQAKRVMRFSRQRVQLDRLLRRGSHFRHLLGAIDIELTRSGCVSRGQSRISGRKRGVFVDHFLEGTDTLAPARRATLSL